MEWWIWWVGCGLGVELDPVVRRPFILGHLTTPKAILYTQSLFHSILFCMHLYSRPYVFSCLSCSTPSSLLPIIFFSFFGWYVTPIVVLLHCLSFICCCASSLLLLKFQLSSSPTFNFISLATGVSGLGCLFSIF